jgi:DNA invertase Pin-like site-specific DNA recombinase
MGRLVGYVCVGAADGDEVGQLEAIGRVDRLFLQRVSGGSVVGVDQFRQMVASVGEGDTVRVKSPDRVARSARSLLAFVEGLRNRGVAVEFVDNPELNTDSPHGEFALVVLAAVAGLERAVIRERQAEGIAIAKRKGVYERVPKLTSEQIALARRRVADGVAKTRVARDLGVSRQTLYAALEGTGKYAGAAS